MAYKIKRYNYYSGRKRNRGKKFLKNTLFVLFLLALLGGGYFLSSYILHRPVVDVQPKPEASQQSSEVSGVSSSAASEPAAVKTDIKAAVMPAATLQKEASVTAFAKKAAADGFNAVVVELKDQNGMVQYKSQAESAVKWKTISPTAVDAQKVCELIKAQGLTPIASLYAFKDNKAPAVLYQNTFTAKGTNKTWLDNTPAKGGKRWLNPYTEAATQYILSLQSELHSFGYQNFFFYGVQFPKSNYLSELDYGENDLSKTQVLADFMSKAGKEALTFFVYDDTADYVYGGDPLQVQSDNLAVVVTTQNHNDILTKLSGKNYIAIGTKAAVAGFAQSASTS